MIWLFNPKISKNEIFAVVLVNVAYGFVLFGGYFGDTQWNAITAINTVLNITATFPQIYTNFTRKSTGQLSYVSYTMNWLGTAARLGTIFYESDDLLFRLQYLVSWGLGLIIQIQFFIYWDEKKKV